MARVRINRQRIDEVYLKAFQDTCFLLHREIIQVITEVGAFPEYPNSDIVDTGNLRGNQQPPEFQGKIAIFRNTATYALWVYLGYTLRNGGLQPGRAWMRLALDRINFTRLFSEVIEL